MNRPPDDVPARKAGGEGEGRSATAEKRMPPKRRKSRASSAKDISPPITVFSRSHFSCKHIGRLLRSSKRVIQWKFVLIEGLDKKEKKVQEHEIALVWSVKSGKKRVSWDRRDITHLTAIDDSTQEDARIAWRSHSLGKEFRITAHMEAPQDKKAPQYDLSVGGSSFLQWPPMSMEELGDVVSDNGGEDGVLSAVNSVAGSGAEIVDEPGGIGFRLSIAGFQASTDFEVVDELRSDMYSSALDTLRHRITECIPQTEEIVSRAFFNAFCLDTDELTSLSSGSSSDGEDDTVDPFQVEANAIWEAYKYVCLNSRSTSGEHEDSLLFMQEQLEAMFLHIRTEKLSADEAFRVLISVASVLGLELATSVPENTVVLYQIDATSDDLLGSMCRYGSITKAGVIRGQRFGVCRFRDESSALRACKAATKKGVVINGHSPDVVSTLPQISRSASEQAPPQQARERRRDCYFVGSRSLPTISKAFMDGEGTESSCSSVDEMFDETKTRDSSKKHRRSDLVLEGSRSSDSGLTAALTPISSPVDMRYGRSFSQE